MTSDPVGEVRVVFVTAPDRAVAESIAAQLVHERLIACANVVHGVRSVYRWEGEVRKEDEVLLILKSTRAVLPGLERRIREIHPYEVPEVLALTVERGSEAYASWVLGEVGAVHE